MDKLFESQGEAINFLVNMNRSFFLDQKEHIKKYYKVRKLHSNVLDSMMNYIDSDKLPVGQYFNTIINDVKREVKNLDISIDNRKCDDAVIFNELFMYKTHYKIPSLTEIYIEKKKFKNPEKIKMLYAMKNSIVGLFKVINYDHMNGYVTYLDVFTKKKYKIIDVSMSSIGEINKGKELYIYNRIITYDEISFGTGIPCVFTSKNKRLREFIKKHNYKSCSDFSRCLILYDIVKNSENMVMRNYHDY